jgi:hypothetical protein
MPGYRRILGAVSQLCDWSRHSVERGGPVHGPPESLEMETKKHRKKSYIVAEISGPQVKSSFCLKFAILTG